MSPARAFSQRSIAIAQAYPLFVVTCAGLSGLIGVFTGSLGVDVAAALTYLLSTAIAGIAIFVPVLLLMKGRTRRFSLIFGLAGFLAGFLPTFLIFLILAAAASDPVGAVLNSGFWLGMVNGILGVISGLLTRYWIRKRLRRNLVDTDDLVEIYA
ncbi:hypothetical protein V0U79_04075 [Hyphobacterium sp. HN65]|uniref:Uncharacterized protein n=1 Tax=Hyphobacterium lacteum TaxID=3116575 RepID=A0ABU7LNN0_9PROT|nr:hypothetical protein [Hyphobacterium sp. HN65]MEE2525531.1 hypothetical protein [Hyphobacterium sp. HN65]